MIDTLATTACMVTLAASFLVMRRSGIYPRCGKCGAINVRIYRDYGMFRWPKEDRCNGCLTDKERGWYVPCCLDEDGNAWGYTSVPEADCERFYSLPENSSDSPAWRRRGGWPDKSPTIGGHN